MVNQKQHPQDIVDTVCSWRKKIFYYEKRTLIGGQLPTKAGLQERDQEQPQLPLVALQAFVQSAFTAVQFTTFHQAETYSGLRFW